MRYRELLRNLVLRDVKLKYRGSVFGFFWSLANPILMVVTYTIAFRYIMQMRTEGFVFNLLLGLLNWTFFASSAMMSTGSVVGAGALVKSVAFPRVILPVATVLFNLVQFLFAIAVFLPLSLVIFGIAPTPAILLFPLLLALQILFISGVAFALATLTSFFRDVSHILEIGLGILFWTTPILYQYGSLPEYLQLPILLSPMSSFIVAYQEIFHYGRVPGLADLACRRQLGRGHVRSRCVAVRRHRGSAGGAGLMSIVIDSQGLSKRFLLRHNRSGSIKESFLGLIHPSRRERTEDFWALRDVSLSVNSGEAVGVIGRNGSGKSTFLRLVAGIHRPTEGRLAVRRGARIGTMIELGIGFHHELTGTENLFLSASVHGLTRAQIEALYDRIVEYSGLAAFMDVPMKNYSSGMTVRLAFAIAANLDPDMLLLDEVFAVGDEAFQQQCIRTVRQFRADGKTILFVSHSAAAIRSICDRVCLLDRGRLLFDGAVSRGLEEYRPRGVQRRASGCACRGGAQPTRRREAGTGWCRADSGSSRENGLFSCCATKGFSPPTRCSTWGAAVSAPAVTCCDISTQAATGAST